MTSNAEDEQHTRGWRALQTMLQGSRSGHGCCDIGEHRMITLGGKDDDADADEMLSSGFIYDTRTKQSTPLPNNMPEARCDFIVVANERFMFAIGGKGADNRAVNTIYRLSLETYEWATLAPMRAARCYCAGVLLDGYFYIFGGDTDGDEIASVERYSIVGNSWEDLPDMAAARLGHCAVAALRNEIYILGGDCTCVLEVFDAALLEWKTETSLCDMPAVRVFAAAVVLQNRYLVLIGGFDEKRKITAGCLIYDCSINYWSSTPASINMITAHNYHTAAVLDGKIVVVGQKLFSMECIDARDILEHAPLNYPLPVEYFDQILQLGKALLGTKYT